MPSNASTESSASSHSSVSSDWSLTRSSIGAALPFTHTKVAASFVAVFSCAQRNWQSRRGAAAMSIAHGALGALAGRRRRGDRLARSDGGRLRRTRDAIGRPDDPCPRRHAAAGPAEGVRVELYELAERREPQLVADVLTNADGRTDKPLISADAGARRTLRARLPRRRLFPRARARNSPTRRSSISSRSASASPTRRRIITCRCSSRRGAIRPIGEAESARRRWAGRPVEAVARETRAARCTGNGLAAGPDAGPPIIWVFLAGGLFLAKTPVIGGWISLDFLGFSRPN